MASSLDHRFLRNTHPGKAGSYLHRIAQGKQFNTAAASKELLNATANESLPPRVYKLWLCACPDTTAILLGMQQTNSVLLRTAAIRAFYRWFRTAKCVDVWRDLGGTEGILEMLATFSVNHVSEFTKQVGRCSNSQALKDERQGLATDLMYCLASQSFPESAKAPNPDHRPLLDLYAKLVPTCIPEARDAWIETKGLPEPNFVQVMQTDTEHYQRQCLKKAGAGHDDIWKYSELLLSLPHGGCSDEPNLPKSTLFAAELLEKTGSLDDTAKTVLEFGGAFRTILRRLARRNVSNSKSLPVVKLISRYAKHSVLQYLRIYHNFREDYLEHLKNIVRLWSRDPDEFGPHLTGLLRKSEVVDMSTITDTLSLVSMDKRHRLLQWLTLHQHDIDIDTVSKLTHIQMPGELFTLLPNDKARDLLEHFATLGNSIEWLRGIHSGSHCHSLPITGPVDAPLDILRCRLIDSHELRLSQASSKVTEYKRMAEKERDPTSRMEWVDASALMSVTSLSLDLFRETMIWVRRYNRDPNISNFYGAGSMLSDPDTVNLLSGIPKRIMADADPDTIATNIRKGNDIALLLLETAAMCQTEPSYYANHWVEVQRLFVEIVECRLNRVNRLQSGLAMTDDMLYEIVWSHTLESVLAAERIGIDEQNEALRFNDMGGPLNGWGRELEVVNPSLSTLRFIDELAKQRDALWQKHRTSLHPEVMSLQAPWPKGLPVHALHRIKIDALLPHSQLPFIRERARDVVFAPPETSLKSIPQDRETQAAIGRYVESYGEALEIHTSWCDAQEKQKRILEAWQYSTTSLSRTGLSPLEARRYWEKVFTKADIPLPDSVLDYPERPLPKLPLLDSHEDRLEWNPDAGPHPSNVPERGLDALCLDCMTAKSSFTGVVDVFAEPKPSIEPLAFPGFWDMERFGSVIPPDAEEAYIATALLLVDTLSQADSKVLSATFPQGDTRFPAAYMDSDFVDQHRSFKNIPLRLLADTPPALIEQLTAALIPKLSGPNKPTVGTVMRAFETLKLLAWSDKPGLAIRHIVHVVVNLPKHSSWHRILLHPGILKRLSKEQSKDLLTGLADAINEKNRERVQTLESRNRSSESSKVQPEPQYKDFVKVTTVKLLAQLMRRATFVDEGYSVNVLVKLIRESTHIDIRVAIVNSLIGIVSATNDPDIEEAVLSTLESQVVPIAAQLSEGNVMTEDDWKKCEDEGEFPGDDRDTPVYDALLLYVKQKQRTNKSKTRELVKRLLLPLVEQMATTGQRWMHALLRVHNLADLAPTIPKAFGAHELLNTLLHEFPSHMPADYFRDLQDLALYFYNPPESVRDLKEAYTSTGKFSKFLGYENWISIYNACTLTTLKIPDLLQKADFATAEDAEANNLLTPGQLQQYERVAIDKLLENYAERTVNWNTLTRRYTPPLRFREPMLLRWQTYCKPQIQYMVERVESVRTPEWQSNPLRRPARLPDTFQLRLWCLTFPSKPHRTAPEDEARKETFARELRGVVGELAASGRPYHAHFAQVVETAKLCYEQEWVGLAARLGAIDREQEKRAFTLEELLRVEFADSLLEVEEPKDCPGLREVKEMLGESWSRCVDEDVRDRGLAMKRSLRALS